MTVFRILIVAALTVALVWVGIFSLSIFGGEERDQGDGRDRSDPQAVTKAVLRALAQGDTDTVKALMTPEAWAQFEREMQMFRSGLVDPDKDPRVKAVVDAARKRLGRAAEGMIASARTGGTAETWRLLVAVYPMDDPPRFAGLGHDPQRPNEVTWLYHGPLGNQRPVNLVRRGGDWYVESIGLL